tara:strand:- start:2941 stop:4026 length:1086 start_codon:yes stop_codon:yes gene_type:complete
MLKYKIYLSDEGYGHIVRQKAILDKLIKYSSSTINFTLQTQNHLNVAKEIFGKGKYVNKYNNISWQKQENGSPDLKKIKSHFENYESKSKDFIVESKDLDEFDFLVSDFVYEAFKLGSNYNIPTFGIAHFTWDWFFSKLYPPSINSKVMNLFFNLADQASKIYFPLFTPVEIIKHYRNSVEVPLIVREKKQRTILNLKTQELNILIIDSGSNLLKLHIEKSIKNLVDLNDIQFFLPNNYTIKAENISYIPRNQLMMDYIESMDLVISRAGFNTISECIACRTPMLLIGEAMNPEINENIINLKNQGLASFISLTEFRNDLHNFLPVFLKNEFQTLKYNMEQHELPLDGADVIAKDILNQIK